MNDKELVPWLEKATLGDESAFQLVYQATHQDVYRTVAFLVYNKQDIEDIVNEIYMRMWRSFHTYDPNRPFRYWLHGITVRQMTCEQFEWTDKAVLQSEMQHELFSLVRQLSYKLRVVVILRYFHDYALEEIADMLQIPVGTVKSRQHLALLCWEQTADRLIMQLPQTTLAFHSDEFWICTAMVRNPESLS